MSIPSQQEIVRHFDECSAIYGLAYQEDAPASQFFRRRREIVASMLSELAGEKVVDVGCGPGVMVEACIQLGFQYVGIDISERMIGECQRRFGHAESAHFLVGKLQSLPTPDNFFDVLLCLGALEYVHADDEAVALTEMVRVTKPGGTLIISHLNGRSPYWLWERSIHSTYRSLKAVVQRLLAGRAGQFEDAPVPVRKFVESSRRSILETHGLAIRDAVYYGFNILLPPFDEKFPRLAIWASRRLEHLSSSRVRSLGMAFVIVAEKPGAEAEPIVGCSRSEARALQPDLPDEGSA